MVPKPNYRMRKERKTGLTTIELQRRFPDLYEATTKAQDEGTTASCSTTKSTGCVLGSTLYTISVSVELTVQVTLSIWHLKHSEGGGGGPPRL